MLHPLAEKWLSLSCDLVSPLNMIMKSQDLGPKSRRDGLGVRFKLFFCFCLGANRRRRAERHRAALTSTDVAPVASRIDGTHGKGDELCWMVSSRANSPGLL